MRCRHKLGLLWVLLLTGCDATDSLQSGEAISLAPGRGSFLYPYPFFEQPLTVWYYLPDNFPPDGRVVIVMHGVKRNAHTYRDQWISHARRFHFLVLAPRFPAQQFSSRGYHQGNMQDAQGRFQPERLWTFTVIDSLFQYVRRLLQLTTNRFALYGHSAGGQFVHRYALFRSSTQADLLIAANTGWYTLPRWDITYPYGLKGSPLTRVDEVARAFQRRLIVLLGEKDTDPQDPYLNNAPEARAQGPHRLARGLYFYQNARQQADSLGLPFCWGLQTVPEVGHSNRGMAGPAAQLIAFPPDSIMRCGKSASSS
ncbi:hypothetical protein [Rhodothermus profundi]|uniref:Alpha/beta hydrolase family protein n=1 Tax=Rhodothermus profundi TaxID=633813 RepID=A0A1M6SY30_9BACT|nr:hypothetical protein [Rhodothermus profundi]SHK49550.1 hypothetical protein SAMN04488087_1273 [Rhodothermus profundi]